MLRVPGFGKNLKCGEMAMIFIQDTCLRFGLNVLCCMFNINVTAPNILWVKQKNGVVIIITKVLRECVGLKRYKIWTVKRALTLATPLGKQALRKSGRLAALSIVAVLLSASGTSAQAHLKKCAHLVAAGDGTETRNSMIVFLQKFFMHMKSQPGCHEPFLLLYCHWLIFRVSLAPTPCLNSFAQTLHLSFPSSLTPGSFGTHGHTSPGPKLQNSGESSKLRHFFFCFLYTRLSKSIQLCNLVGFLCWPCGSSLPQGSRHAQSCKALSWAQVFLSLPKGSRGSNE